MTQIQRSKQGLLQKALLGNALFSTISGLVILFANRRLVEFLGLPSNASLILLGVGLIGYASLLVFNARGEIKVSDAWVAVILDLAWVLGSGLLLLLVPLSTGGKWLVGMIADLVLLFAVLQWLGIRRVTSVRST